MGEERPDARNGKAETADPVSRGRGERDRGGGQVFIAGGSSRDRPLNSDVDVDPLGVDRDIPVGGAGVRRLRLSGRIVQPALEERDPGSDEEDVGQGQPAHAHLLGTRLGKGYTGICGLSPQREDRGPRHEGPCPIISAWLESEDLVNRLVCLVQPALVGEHAGKIQNQVGPGAAGQAKRPQPPDRRPVHRVSLPAVAGKGVHDRNVDRPADNSLPVLDVIRQIAATFEVSNCIVELSEMAQRGAERDQGPDAFYAGIRAGRGIKNGPAHRYGLVEASTQHQETSL